MYSTVASVELATR